MFRFLNLVVLGIVIAAAMCQPAHSQQRAGLLYDELQSGAVGSYAQWTENVAVTVFHNPANSTLFGVECADVKFIARKGTPLQWAEGTLDDQVVAVGFSALEDREGVAKHEVSGKVNHSVVPLCELGGRSYLTYLMMFDGQALPGMSGGPVFRAKDGRAIGIVKGTHRDLHTTAFVTYEMIKKAWDYGRLNGLVPNP
ncbi:MULTISPECIES: trypsin-like peptidase domain-containing protein [Herbaspirillum]|uniref:Trypsin-like peptidase domain-containing protein n=2 Tax=Herbaspirillum huttiense TaxID=863372 RepID=A0AAJ2HDJ0_9BURK|nr:MULTISPECIES: trypsin-like peptidase domain-containing protein [Herbaspirillum]MDR9836790.1 trypsin-like peptidase domain-containing protein [Herbaspirillum huttiense]